MSFFKQKWNVLIIKFLQSLSGHCMAGYWDVLLFLYAKVYHAKTCWSVYHHEGFIDSSYHFIYDTKDLNSPWQPWSSLWLADVLQRWVWSPWAQGFFYWLQWGTGVWQSWPHHWWKGWMDAIWLSFVWLDPHQAGLWMQMGGKKGRVAKNK